MVDSKAQENGGKSIRWTWIKLWIINAIQLGLYLWLMAQDFQIFAKHEIEKDVSASRQASQVENYLGIDVGIVLSLIFTSLTIGNLLLVILTKGGIVKGIKMCFRPYNPRDFDVMYSILNWGFHLLCQLYVSLTLILFQSSSFTKLCSCLWTPMLTYS